jgi:hypothetical protein
MVAKKAPKQRPVNPSDRRLKENKNNKPIITSKQKNTDLLDGEHPEKIEITDCYCRRCMEIKKADNFFKATDTILDKNEKMSVCKECVSDLYIRYWNIEKNLDNAMLRLCRILNWRYEKDLIPTLEDQLEKAGKSPDDPTVPGLYRIKITMKSKHEQGGNFFGSKSNDDSLSFREPMDRPTIEIDEDAFGEETPNLKVFWGESFSYQDYVFLEAELALWKGSHKADTYAEISLLKELCYKELEIRKARIEQKSTSALVKEKQDLMKTASVDPAKANMASSGKSMDTFSAFIKTIEETEPAEYYKDKELFKDFDNIAFYFEKYVRRPLKNFVTGSRDFNVDADSDNDEEYDDYDKYGPTPDVIEEDVKDGGKDESISG